MLRDVSKSKRPEISFISRNQSLTKSPVQSIFLISYSAPNWSIHRNYIVILDRLVAYLPFCLSQALHLRHDLFGRRRPKVKTPQTGKFKDSMLCLFDLILNVPGRPINNLSVIKGRVFLG